MPTNHSQLLSSMEGIAAATDGVDTHEVELPHEPAKEVDAMSTDLAEISRYLRAGVVLNACAGAAELAEVREVKRRVVDEPPPMPGPCDSHEEMGACRGGLLLARPGKEPLCLLRQGDPQAEDREEV